MIGLIDLLLLLPLIFIFWLTIKIANACAKRGGRFRRLLGVLSSLIIGGVCVQVGYWFTEEGMTILGWIDMVGGGLMAILGTLTALLVMKEEVEIREKRKKMEEINRQLLKR